MRIQDLGDPKPGLGEFGIERQPNYSGGVFSTAETFDTRADAISYIEALVDGILDEFLANAWYRIRLLRNRDFTGRFTRPPWVVVVDYRRPAKDEIYRLEPQPPLSTYLEVS